MLRLVSFDMDYYWACNRIGSLSVGVPEVINQSRLILIYQLIQDRYISQRETAPEHCASPRDVLVYKLHVLRVISAIIYCWAHHDLQ
jgi:hypothetical protein